MEEKKDISKKPVEEPKKFTEFICEVINCINLNIREKSDATSEVLELAHAGDILTLKENAGEWLKVETPSGTIGYCMSKYISIRSK